MPTTHERLEKLIKKTPGIKQVKELEAKQEKTKKVKSKSG